MPGYFMMLNITMLAMFKASKPTAPGIWGHVVQLLTLHVLQLNNVVVFLVSIYYITRGFCTKSCAYRTRKIPGVPGG